jgi:hypothetical protein
MFTRSHQPFKVFTAVSWMPCIVLWCNACSQGCKLLPNLSGNIWLSQETGLIMDIQTNDSNIWWMVGTAGSRKNTEQSKENIPMQELVLVL